MFYGDALQRDVSTAPRNLEIVPDPKGALVQWSDPLGAQKYICIARKTAAPFDFSTFAERRAFSVSRSKRATPMRYSYRVEALNARGQSPLSDTVEFVRPPAPTP